MSVLRLVRARRTARRKQSDGQRGIKDNIRKNIEVFVWKLTLTGRVGSGDDLHELLRDLRLASAVHLLLQVVLQFLGVVHADCIADMRAASSDATDSCSVRRSWPFK